MYILSLLLCFTAFTKAQSTSGNIDPSAPDIKFEKDTIDYGTIELGANGERVFTFKNTGKSPLVISEINTPCGCTKPDTTIVNKPVPPGAKEHLKIKYDTTRMGQFTKTITINSNAKSGTVYIVIKGTVKAKQGDNASPGGSPVRN